MCGIFGGIGKNINYGAIRTLALANAERGNEAIGFFGSDGKIWKRAQSPIDALMGGKLNKYLAGARANSLWFVAGHTRHGTRGQNTRENAHPFRYGNIVGAHNGIVAAPNEYAVDSMYIFDALNKAGNDYQKALEDVSGYWGLVWFDGDAVYLQAHDNTLNYATVDGCVYFSSDARHLRAALGNVETVALKEGETLKLTMNGDEVVITPLASLDNKADSMAWDWRTGGSSYYGTSSKGGSKYTGGTTTTTDPFAYSSPDDEYAALMGLREAAGCDDIPDYDARWGDAWQEYVHEYAD